MHHIRPVALIALLLAGTAVAAPGRQARIKGTVTDGQGKPVPDVKIVVTTKAVPSFRMETKTDKDGHWAALLADATRFYDYRFEKAGYVTVNVADKKVPAGFPNDADPIRSSSLWVLDVQLVAQEPAATSGK